MNTNTLPLRLEGTKKHEEKHKLSGTWVLCVLGAFEFME